MSKEVHVVFSTKTESLRCAEGIKIRLKIKWSNLKCQQSDAESVKPRCILLISVSSWETHKRTEWWGPPSNRPIHF